MRLITFGARVQQLRLPDQTGADPNLIAGFVTLQDYLQQPEPFGALMGPDCLHPTHTDWQNWNWDAQIVDDAVVMQLRLPDGVNALPGTQTITITHQLNDDNVWQAKLQVQSDTAIQLRPNYNLAFMLTGDPARTIDHQQLTLGNTTTSVHTIQTAQSQATLADERWTLTYQTSGVGLAITTFDHIDEATNLMGSSAIPELPLGFGHWLPMRIKACWSMPRIRLNSPRRFNFKPTKKTPHCCVRSFWVYLAGLVGLSAFFSTVLPSLKCTAAIHL